MKAMLRKPGRGERVLGDALAGAVVLGFLFLTGAEQLKKRQRACILAGALDRPIELHGCCPRRKVIRRTVEAVGEKTDMVSGLVE